MWILLGLKHSNHSTSLPKNSVYHLQVRWTPAWPIGSVHVQRGLLHMFLMEDAVAWMERCMEDQSHAWKHGDCWINMLASFITQPLALDFLHSRSNSLPNNDKCLHPCDCCPRNPPLPRSNYIHREQLVEWTFILTLMLLLFFSKVQLLWCKWYILISFYGCIHPISSISTELDEPSSAKEEAHITQAEGEQWWMVPHMWQIKHLTSNLLFLITWNIARKEGQGKK